jgi:hypothetical protein
MPVLELILQIYEFLVLGRVVDDNFPFREIVSKFVEELSPRAIANFILLVVKIGIVS